MGMVVVLLAARAEDLSLGPETTARLAQLGVTYAALLSDDEGAAVLLDGARFRPERSTGAALDAIAGQVGGRTLRPLAQMSIPAS
jgi:hypothetical protein